MNYLVTVASLSIRDGSSLAALEVAEELRRRGHTVALFTLRPGTWAALSTGLTCWSPDDLEQVAAFHPERVVLFHWPTYFELQRAGIVAPTVFGFLGVVPPLENPPPLTEGLAFPWFAVSESIATQVASQPSWAPSPHQILRNWTSWSPRPVGEPGPLRKVAIVSNRMPEALEAQIRHVAEPMEIEVTRFGLPHNSVEIRPELLAGYDAVISIGRTVLDAMQIGIPVLVCDLHGCDGWATPADVERQSSESFSGRMRSHQATDDEFRNWFSNPPDRASLVELQTWVQARATIALAIDGVEDLFKHASRPTVSWGRFGEAVVEAWQENRRLSDALLIREAQLSRITLERDAAVGILHRLRAAGDLVRPRFLMVLMRRVVRRWIVRPE